LQSRHNKSKKTTNKIGEKKSPCEKPS